MKKILAIAVAALMTVALCISASALHHTSPDQILAGSDGHDLASVGGNNAAGTDIGAITEESFYFWGWHSTEVEGGIVEFGYRYGDVTVLGSPKFYHDNSNDAGKADNDTIASQCGGVGESVRFRIEVPVLKGEQEVVAVVKLADGTVEDMWTVKYSAENGRTLADITPKADDPAPADPTPADNPGTADASVIAIAAVACIALAGVVVAKKVK